MKASSIPWEGKKDKKKNTQKKKKNSPAKLESRESEKRNQLTKIEKKKKNVFTFRVLSTRINLFNSQSVCLLVSPRISSFRFLELKITVTQASPRPPAAHIVSN